ncbi:MAG: hypothetical protein Kow00114_29940 [Kiloniellaceae bacterium]
MARAVTLNRTLLGLALLSLALGLWQLGGAAAIHAKAWLAQHLIERAWAATLAGGGDVKPWPWADTWPVSRLKVPDLGVDLYVLAGASGRSLAFGPAEVPGTEGLDHRILSGHRDTHFAFLRDLADGARFSLQARDGRWHDYAVRGRQVIDLRHPVTARRAAGADLVTLVTCWPFDAIEPGGPLRYAVTAEALPDRSDSSLPLGEAAFLQPAPGGTPPGDGAPLGAPAL